jgi:hypothetical protein
MGNGTACGLEKGVAPNAIKAVGRHLAIPRKRGAPFRSESFAWSRHLRPIARTCPSLVSLSTVA